MTTNVGKSYFNERGNHICTLHQEECRLFEVDNELKSILKNSTTISTENPITKFYFRSLAAIETERLRHKKMKNTKWVIHPLSLFRFYWESLYVFLLYIGLLIIPINVMDGPLDDNGSHIRIGFNFNVELLTIFTDLLYMADVLMTFFTGHCDYKKKVITLDSKAIALNYLSSLEFYLDLIAILTTLMFLKLYTYIFPGFLVVNYLTQLLYLQPWRIRRFLRYLNNMTEKIRHFYYSRITIRYCILFHLCIHWTTCIYIRLVQFDLLYSDRTDYVINTFIYEMTLLHGYLTMYIQMQHKVISQLLTISSYNDFPVINYTSRPFGFLLYVVLSLSGFIFSTIAMILFIQIFISLNESEVKYHSIMSQLWKYMSYKTLPKNMKDRIVCYYDYRFQKKYFNEARIMNMLSGSLEREINLYSCRSLIEAVSILRELPQDIIAEVVHHLQHQVFLYDDVIVKAGTSGDCMYFIAYGTVAISTPTGREICHLQDGAYFGEIALISEDQKRIANVIAIEICEVYRLDRAHFLKCFDPSSSFHKRIVQIAQERMEKTLLLEQLHKKHLMDNIMLYNFTRKQRYDPETIFL